MIIYDRVTRLESEPLLEDLPRGFAAELADPAWLLGRQWQLGEHLGEDASSPVRVEYLASIVPIDPPGGDPNQDPRRYPAEAIVESEPGQFWTPGRRIASGRRVAAAAPPLPPDPTLLLARLPVPYDVLNGTGLDGRALWARRVELGLDPDWFGAIPPDPEPADMWDPAELAYNADFTSGTATLTLRRHDGGALDWYSVDADGQPHQPSPTPAVSMFVGRATYPGAPALRWWEIENAAVDIGGYPPDRAHFATLLLIDLITAHSDDWFSFPVTGASSGHVITLRDVVVHDSFDEEWQLFPPEDWTLFSVFGLDPRSLVAWPAVATPLLGPAIDEVVIGIDEDANLVWAVERRIDGTEVPTPERPAPVPPPTVSAQDRPGYSYRASTDVPLGWHPYVIEDTARRRYVQARTADLSGPTPVLNPEPTSDLLRDPAAPPDQPPHRIEPAAIPGTGLRLERRAVLARRTDGQPVLWTQRSTQPLLTPPALALRWDRLEPTTVTP